MIVVGCDPGTGVKSPTGLVSFDSGSKVIFGFTNIRSKSKTTEGRAKDIAIEVGERVSELKPGTFCIENFVMRGKGGQTLQRFIGAVLSHLPEGWEIKQPFNTAVKRIVAGDGDADKRGVAEGVHKFFYRNPKSSKIIEELILNEEWDILDAFAIGIAGVSNEIR
jgi:Holliday junction resolvasome RuvABC endonuclease subunit